MTRISFICVRSAALPKCSLLFYSFGSHLKEVFSAFLPGRENILCKVTKHRLDIDWGTSLFARSRRYYDGPCKFSKCRAKILISDEVAKCTKSVKKTKQKPINTMSTS